MGNVLVWVRLVRRRLRVPRGALAVVIVPNPFFSALALIGNLASLAVLYLLLGGEFVAAAQVLVYAGAVMVMFLFVIAYLGDRTPRRPGRAGRRWQASAPCVAAGAILVEVIVAIGLDAGDALGDAARASRARSAARRRSGGCSSPTTCSPSRSPRSCCSSPRSAASSSARTRAAGARPSPDGERPMNGPDVTWYLALARVLFVDRRARRAPAPQPADHPALARDHAQRREPRPDRVRAPLGSDDGQIFALAVMAVAASEVVVGLGLIVAMGRRLELDVDKLTTLRG